MKFASRVLRLSPSPIRDILRVIDQPGMISFAGGLPCADSFPEFSLGSLNHKQLQYGTTEGEWELRETIAVELAQRGMDVSTEQILILSGSQQGIDLVAKLLVEEGTRVAVESPTYLAAVQVFSLYGARYENYTADTISELIADQCPENYIDTLRLTYAIPTFQNPTGYCYTLAQRRALASACDRNGSVLFEDDPYRDLAYDLCDRQPVCSFVKSSSWIYQSSFSKTLAPGLRLGYLACSTDLYEKLSWLKQATDLHSNRLSQYLVLRQLQDEGRDQRMAAVVANYRKKRDYFDRLLNQYLSEFADWTVPKGGLFFWLKLKSASQLDEQTLFASALDKQVAIMPGTPFFVEQTGHSQYIRLNFSHVSEAQCEAGLERLSGVLRDLLR